MSDDGDDRKAAGSWQPPGQPLSPRAEALVFTGIFLAVLMGGLDALVVSTALPTIAVDLHQVTGITFVVSGYLIASTVAIPIFARLSDIYSRRNVFVVGLVIFMVGSVCAGLSQNLSQLIAFRAVQGFGLGGLFPVAIAMVAVLFPPHRRAQVTGLLTGAAGISIVAGPLIGSYIVDVTTWRWVFYINLPVGALGIIVLLTALGPLRPATTGKFDLLGTATLAGWVGCVMLALVQVSEAGWAWTDPRVLGLLVAAGVLLGAFLAVELRVREPLVPLRLLKQRAIAASSGSTLFSGIILSSLITFLSVFVGIVLLASGPNSANDVRDVIYFVAIPLVLGAGLSGQLLTRLPYRAVVAPGLALAAVSSLFLIHLTASTPLWTFRAGFLLDGGLVLPLIPLGFGIGMALTGTTIAVQNEAPPREVGAAVGLVRFFQSLGGALGISLLTAYQSWVIGTPIPNGTIPPALLPKVVASFNDLFIVQAAILFVALAFALFLRGRLPSAPDGEPPAPAAATRAEVTGPSEPTSP